jgi:transcriptional regulator with GAF, ATPase, and Fis domain
MEQAFQTGLARYLREILPLASASAGSFVVIDTHAAATERIVAEATSGIIDLNAYKQWLRKFFLDNPAVFALGCHHEQRCVVISSFHSVKAFSWTPHPTRVIKVLGRGSIQGFLFLALEETQELSASITRAIAEAGIQYLKQFDDLVPSSSYSLLRRIGFVGESEAFQGLADQLKRIARQADAPVLITGERGAGKELAALAIHYLSPRRDKPFLAVNCAALHSDLYAAELFGYRKGAFTGAVGDRPGKFKSAEGGTLFLDEITEIPQTVCAGLLRALDHGEIQSLGYDTPSQVDVRILAATNRDIQQFVDEQKFPADVFDRLNVLSVRVPPLRERKEDIPVLASYFCRKFCVGLAAEGIGLCKICMETGSIECLEAQVIRALKDHDWPGNIRELKNTVIRLITEKAGRGKSFTGPGCRPARPHFQSP